MTTFIPTADIVSMTKDDIDEQILFQMNDMLEKGITEDDITDEMRQKFVDFSWNLMMDAISLGEYWYGITISEKTAELFK